MTRAPSPGGLLVELANAVERARIARYRTRLRASGLRGLLNLSASGGVAALVGVALASIATAIDVWALPAVGVTTESPPDVVPLLTTIAGFTGLLAVSVSASTGPVQAAAARLPVEVTAELIDDPARDGLLRLVVVTFVAAGTLLFARIVLGLPVLVGALAVVVVAAITLTAVVGYIGTRLRLYRPAYVAERWANDMVRWNRGTASGPEGLGGRSVTAHIRGQYEVSLKRFEALILALVRDEQREALDVFILLAQVAATEIHERRRIPETSSWFPKREEYVTGYNMAITPIFQSLALGRPRISVHDRQWVERSFAAIAIAGMERTANSPGSGLFTIGVVTVLEELLAASFDQQEFSTVDSYLDVVDWIIRTPDVRRQVLDRLPAVPFRLAGLADTGLSIDHLDTYLAGQNAFPSPGEVRAAELPTELHKALLDMSQRVEAGRRIAERHEVSKTDAISELKNDVRARESDVKTRYRKRTADLLAAMVDTKEERLALAATANALLAAHQRVIKGDWATGEQLLERVAPSLAEVLLQPGSDEDREAVLEEARLLATLSIVSTRPRMSELLVRPVVHVIATRGKNDVSGRPLYDLLAIGGLALVASDLEQQPGFVEQARLGMTDAGLIPVEVGRFVSSLATNDSLGFPFPFRLPYHDFIRRLEERISQLPRRPLREVGGIPFSDEPVHTSDLIRSLGKGHLMTIDMEDLQIAFARHLAGPPKGAPAAPDGSGPQEVNPQLEEDPGE